MNGLRKKRMHVSPKISHGWMFTNALKRMKELVEIKGREVNYTLIYNSIYYKCINNLINIKYDFYLFVGPRNLNKVSNAKDKGEGQIHDLDDDDEEEDEEGDDIGLHETLMVEEEEDDFFNLED